MQQLLEIQRVPSKESYGLSLWFGTVLIAVGVGRMFLPDGTTFEGFWGWNSVRLFTPVDRKSVV